MILGVGIGERLLICYILAISEVLINEESNSTMAVNSKDVREAFNIVFYIVRGKNQKKHVIRKDMQELFSETINIGLPLYGENFFIHAMTAIATLRPGVDFL